MYHMLARELEGVWESWHHLVEIRQNVSNVRRSKATDGVYERLAKRKQERHQRMRTPSVGVGGVAQGRATAIVVVGGEVANVEEGALAIGKHLVQKWVGKPEGG